MSSKAKLNPTLLHDPVPGLIPSGEVTVLGFHPDAGKQRTVLLRQLASAVANGTPFLGHFPVTQSKTALFSFGPELDELVDDAPFQVEKENYKPIGGKGRGGDVCTRLRGLNAGLTILGAWRGIEMPLGWYIRDVQGLKNEEEVPPGARREKYDRKAEEHSLAVLRETARDLGMAIIVPHPLNTDKGSPRLVDTKALRYDARHKLFLFWRRPEWKLQVPDDSLCVNPETYGLHWDDERGFNYEGREDQIEPETKSPELCETDSVVLEYLRNVGQPVGLKAIEKGTGKRKPTVDSALKRLVKRGQIRKGEDKPATYWV